ncbi:MAG: ISL3 family transposase [Bacteroidota bacterium]
MAKGSTFRVELGLSDIKVKRVEVDHIGDYHISVSCTAIRTRCSRCGKVISTSHGHCKASVIEHLPILDCRVFIHVKWPRFICADCDDKTTSFRPNWVNATGQMTVAYEDYVLKCLINTTAKDVAEKLRITEDIVEGLVDRRIALEVDWSQYHPVVLGLDEIAMKKGHKQYLTIISDISIAGKTRVIAVLKGRTRDDILPFLRKIPDRVIANLQGICIDMSGSYFSALKERIGNQEVFEKLVTIDRFHLAKLIGEKVDKVRKKILNQLRQEHAKNEATLEALKGTMWPFRHHPEQCTDEEAAKLEELFHVEPTLRVLRDLREDLYHIFETQHTKEEAKDTIETWIEKAEQHDAFKGFIKTYREFEANILNYFIHRYNSGPVEGLNNKIKVIKRRCFGFRNITYFAKRIFLDVNYKPVLIPV